MLYIKNSNSSIFWLGILYLIMIGLLIVMGVIVSYSDLFKTYYLPMLVINIGISVLLVCWLGWYFVGLFIQWLKNPYQQTLRNRLIRIIGFLTLMPVAVVYLFALDAMNRSIDSWFDIRVESTIKNATNLSRTAVNTLLNEQLTKTKSLAKSYNQVNQFELIAQVISKQRTQVNAYELTLLRNAAQVIAFSSENSDQILPFTPSESDFQKLRVSGPLVDVITRDNLSFVRTLVNVDFFPNTWLQALYPITDTINELQIQLEKSKQEFQTLLELRKPLKQSLVFHLSLALLITFVGAILLAVKISQNLTLPIFRIAQGAEKIASGQSNVKVSKNSRDEIGFLVEAFNTMANKIDLAKLELNQSKNTLQQRNQYLNTVLENMSSGVLSISETGNLTTYNQAARKILDINLAPILNNKIAALGIHNPQLRLFLSWLAEKKVNTSKEIKIESPSHTQTLICIIRKPKNYRGFLVVFDDISSILASQRESAWKEVAQKMAHEIKNPLTPIQLSVERLQRKYLANLDLENRSQANRIVQTIIEHVTTIKNNAESFADYAKNPQIDFEEIDLGALIQSTILLYSNQQVQFIYQQKKLLIQADKNRLLQVFNNIIKNGLEALDEIHQTITITTYGDESGVRVDIHNTGKAIEKKILSRIFEPYISTKVKGTGLGMAIVKRIIEEHNGWVKISNTKKGVCVSLYLPKKILIK